MAKCPGYLRVLYQADLDGSNVESIASSSNNYQSWTEISLDKETRYVHNFVVTEVTLSLLKFYLCNKKILP